MFWEACFNIYKFIIFSAGIIFVGIFKHMGSFFKILFILFLAALGLRCCARAFSSCGEQGLLFVAVSGLLLVVASLVAEHGL